MANIGNVGPEISKTPKEYQKYFIKADKRNNFQSNNKGILDPNEAESAAQEYCMDNPSKCDEILKYLKSIYPEPTYSRIRDSIRMNMVDNENEVLERANKDILDLTNDKNSYTRAYAANDLQKIAKLYISLEEKSKMVAPLLDALKDQSGDVKQMSVIALCALSSQNISLNSKAEMVDPLINALNDQNSNVRMFVQDSLANLKKSDISQELKSKIDEALKKVNNF